MTKIKDYYQLEKNILKLKEKIDDLKESEDTQKKDKIADLKKQIEAEWQKIKPLLKPLHIVQLARHPQRPYTLDYIDNLLDQFIELHGDRRVGDDTALISGFGFFHGRTVAVIGHQKGRTTKQRLDRNFGQPNPEGYRKALRVMRLAEKFKAPVLTLIDTPGAYPGIQAEERGQAEAIAYNLHEISKLKIPIVNIVIGEGGSGGALGVGVGDYYLMLENSFYSVISPEGCAAILWKDQSAVQQAAENLRIGAQDLKDLGIIDKIIPEPSGGAHVDPEEMFKTVDGEIQKILKKLEEKPVDNLLEDRYKKFRKIGVFTEK
ncbi:MAG: acetyl-CoA carboxylase carboxyltransferase subunit alpha [Candidatus Aminicenantes bacterium]|nr:acetyl-CoA carboxylase carboxyltransferase subunit alpha [Candidatus Aminicenantes bacterium]